MQEGPAEEGGAGPHGQWSRTPVPPSGGAMCHWSTTFGSRLKPRWLRFAAVLRLELAARVRSRAEEDSSAAPPALLRAPDAADQARNGQDRAEDDSDPQDEDHAEEGHAHGPEERLLEAAD